MKNNWIEVNVSWEKFGNADPGVLVEMEDGEQYLIGHMNRYAGVCDCCIKFDPDTIVRRYKVVWKNDR